jgi:hypothetical protein
MLGIFLPTKDLLRLIYHRRALSNELLLRAVTATSFLTIPDGSLMQLGGFSCIRRLLDRAKESNHSESECCKRQSRPQPR